MSAAIYRPKYKGEQPSRPPAFVRNQQIFPAEEYYIPVRLITAPNVLAMIWRSFLSEYSWRYSMS